MEQVRLAIVGAGSMGLRHAELVRAHHACRLAGVCDVDPTRRAAAEALGVPFHPCIGDLIEREQPDGAIIATPNAQHAHSAETCAEASVHVLIEKPIADTLDQAHRIIEAAKQHGIAVLVGHHRRHNPLVQKARDLVRGGALGKLVAVSILWALLKPDDYFDVAWRRERPGGGPLLINLIHELDSLRFVCGDVASVCAHVASATRGFEVEDSLSISFAFASGALGTVLASDATPAPWSYELTTAENPAYFHAAENCTHFLGTAASLAFPTMELWRYADPSQRGWCQPMERSRLDVPPADPLKRQLGHFCRVVRGEDEPLVGAEDASRSLALALAVRESAERGTPINPSTLFPNQHHGA